MEFIAQPLSPLRLGTFLQAHLADLQWTSFRAAVAFVKRSGTQHIRQPLLEFSNRAQVKLSVGIDLKGSSSEGLNDLLQATPNGEVFVYRNSPRTFHPKIYLFKNEDRADIVVGSGNLTSGGLFTNYEAAVVASLNLNILSDLAFLQVIEQALDTWSQPQMGVCYLLTPDFLGQLVSAGFVLSEAEIAAMQHAAAAVQPPAVPPTAGGAATHAPLTAPLFVSFPVPPAPPIPTTAIGVIETETEPDDIEVPVVAGEATAGVISQQIGGVTSYVITLQRTDVGFGQTTAGTSPRSPEVFVPLAALDLNPAFWNFPDAFTPDEGWNTLHPQWRRNGIGKMDRIGVPMRIGVVRPVNMFFNPRKKDLRLRNPVLRSSGNPGDIILVRRVDPANGFEYDIQVAPQGSPLFEHLLPACNTPVRNSDKQFGYF
jgi:hypothetical protein